MSTECSLSHNSVRIENLIHIGNNIYTDGLVYIFRVLDYIICITYKSASLDICYVYKYTSANDPDYINHERGYMRSSLIMNLTFPRNFTFSCVDLLMEKSNSPSYTLYINSLPRLLNGTHNCTLLSHRLESFELESREKLINLMENTPSFQFFYKQFLTVENMSKQVMFDTTLTNFQNYPPYSVQLSSPIVTLVDNELWENLVHIGNGIYCSLTKGIVCKVGISLINITYNKSTKTFSFTATLHSNKSADLTFKTFLNGIYFSADLSSHIHQPADLDLKIIHRCRNFNMSAVSIETGKFNSVTIHHHLIFNQCTPSIHSSSFCDRDIHWNLYRINSNVEETLKKYQNYFLSNIYKALEIVKKINENV